MVAERRSSRFGAVEKVGLFAEDIHSFTQVPRSYPQPWEGRWVVAVDSVGRNVSGSSRVQWHRAGRC